MRVSGNGAVVSNIAWRIIWKMSPSGAAINRLNQIHREGRREREEKEESSIRLWRLHYTAFNSTQHLYRQSIQE